MSSRPVEQGGFRGYVPSVDDDEQQSISVIDQFSTFDGTYQSTRDLRIEGQVKGTIECRGTLHIAQGADVDATVEAENISVAGELDGEIVCRGKLLLLPSGRVRGKISTRTLIIHEGAFYEGDLEMGGETGRIPARTRRPVAPPAASPATSTAGTTAPIEEPVDDEPAAPAEEPSQGSAQAQPNTFIRRFGGQEQQWDGGRQSDDS